MWTSFRVNELGSEERGLSLRFNKNIPNYDYDENKINVDKLNLIMEMPKNKMVMVVLQ